MAGVDLAAYIAQQTQAGYSAQQIRQALIQYGYDVRDIDEAFKRVGSRSVSPLAFFVAKQLAQGYSAEQVKSYLLNYGYPPPAVEEALKDAAGKGSGGILASKTLLIAFLALVFVGIFAAGMYYFLHNQSSYDFEIEDKALEYYPGDTLIIKNIFSNNKFKDPVLVYRIINEATGETVDTWSETLVVSKKGTAETVWRLPADMSQGIYLITAKVQGETGLEANERISVKIKDSCSNKRKDVDEEGVDCGGVCKPCVEIPTCSDGKKNQEEVGIDCGGPCSPCSTPSCSDGIKNQDETAIDCGGVCKPCKDTCSDGIKNNGEEGIDCGGPCRACETCFDGFKNQDEHAIDCGGVCKPCKVTPNAEFLQQAKNLAAEDSKSAMELCKQITERFWSDTCYREVAKLSNTSSYCALASPVIRDQCYIHFISLGNFDVCENIVDTYVRMNCESLKSIRTTSEQPVQKNGYSDETDPANSQESQGAEN